MKVLTINSSGNVGKSFIAREVFLNNMEGNAKLYEVEEHNTGNNLFAEYLQDRYENLVLKDEESIDEYFKNLYKEKNSVTDVGSSVVFDFLEKTSTIGVLEYYDYIVIPTNITTKEINDTLKFIEYLIDNYDIKKDKIVIFANKFSDEEGSNIKNYDTLKEKLKALGIINIFKIPFYKNYAKIERKGVLTKDIVGKAEEFKEIADEELAKDNPNMEKVNKYLDLFLFSKKAEKMHDELENFYLNLAIRLNGEKNQKQKETNSKDGK